MLLVLILVLTLFRGILYASLVPPWQTPDEPKHFEYVALLQEKGRLVTYEDASPALQREIISSMRVYDFWRFGYANSPEQASHSFEDVWNSAFTELDRPPLYYLAASLAYAPFRGMSVDTQLYAIRLFSVVLGVLTVLMTFLAVRTIFPEDAFLPSMAAIFVSFLPMHTFVTSSVNSDNMANLVAAALAYALARLFKGGASIAKVAGILLLVGAGLWSKRTTVFMLPLTAMTIPLYLFGRRPRASTWAFLGGTTMVLGAALALVARSGRLRDGVGWVLDHYFFNDSAATNLAHLFGNKYTLDALLELYSGFLRRIFDSFWARFGWMNVRLDAFWYDILVGVALLGFIGLLHLGLRLAMRHERLEGWQARIMVLYLLWMVLVVVITFIHYTADFSTSSFPQGRYLFPALVPIATYFALGLKHLLPKSLQPTLLLAMAGGFFLLDTLGMGLYILPFYYQPG